MTEVLREVKDRLQWTKGAQELVDLAENYIQIIRNEDGFNELTHQDFHIIILTAFNDYMMTERLGWHEGK